MPAPTKAPRFVVTETHWDNNGAHHVTVVDTAPASSPGVSQTDSIAATRRAARELARRSVSRPQAVKWTRLDLVFLTEHEGTPRLAYKFTVSRLDRSYR